MNSAHDLGGMHGFGNIDRSQRENFTHQWEEKVFGLTLACGLLGQWNLDESRYARERMEAGEYLRSGYYEHWLHGLERLLVEKRLVTVDELESGRSEQKSGLSPVAADKIPGILKSGAPVQMRPQSMPLFQTGQLVRVRNFHPKTHTRAPRYVRSRSGRVSAHYGAYIFPDLHSARGEKRPAHLYSVRFEAGELWGEQDAEGRSAVYVDLFEPYLQAAGV